MISSDSSSIQALDSKLNAIHKKMIQLASRTEYIENALAKLSSETLAIPAMLSSSSTTDKEPVDKSSSVHLSTKEFWKEADNFAKEHGPFTKELARLYIPYFTQKHFGLTHFSTAVQSFKNGQLYKFDMFAYSVEPSRSAMLIATETEPTEKHILMLLEDLAIFPQVLPKYCKQSLWGMLVGHIISPTIKESALAHGLFVGTVQEDGFVLQTPDTFTGKDFHA